MISDDNVFEENKGILSATGAVNSNRSQKKLSLYQKALSSNNILVEDGRMSRSKRKLNLKTLFTSSDDDTNTNLQRCQLQHQRRFSDRQKSIGHSKNTPDSSNIKISNVQTSLEYLNNLEESLNDLDMISRTCKQNFKKQQTTVIPTAKSNTLQPTFGKKNSKSFTNLFGGMRTWFRSSTTNAVDKNGDDNDGDNNISKSTSGNFLLSKSLCTSSGKKKNRTSLNVKNEKSDCDDDAQRDRSMSKLLDYEDTASTSLSTKRRKSGDRKKDNSKKRVKRFLFNIIIF